MNKETEERDSDKRNHLDTSGYAMTDYSDAAILEALDKGRVLYVERRMIERIEVVARKWHSGQLRKDGKTPYVVHPEKVAEQMGKWGFEPECDGWAVAVAWAHDLLEETPLEKREEVECDIKRSCSGLLNESDKVLAAVRLLTRDKEEFPNKADYIANVASRAEFPVLAVKIADRLCNTRDFLVLPGAGATKAARYFAAGEPLFKALAKFDDGRKKRIDCSIKTVRTAIAD